jgi:RimJ/RimL family protein N-acetyltransferase
VTELIAPVVSPGTMATARQPDLAVDTELRLRPWTSADASTVVRAFSDPDIQHWHFRRCDSERDALAWIADCSRQWVTEECATWAIISVAHDEVVGRIAVYTDLRDGYGQVSYWILADARRRGIATRSVRAVTHWAHSLGLHRIELQHSTRNQASAGVARAAGFIKEGIRRGANLHDDGWHDMQLYSHLATD